MNLPYFVVPLIIGTATLGAQEFPVPPDSPPPAPEPAPFTVRPDPSLPPPVIPGTLSGEATAAPPPPPPPPQPKIIIPEENTLTTETTDHGNHTVTIKKVLPVELPPEPAPAPPVVVDPAKAAAFRALAASRPKRHILMLSGTIYDGETTHIRWQGSTPGRSFEAWSNINFDYLRGLGTLRLPSSEILILAMGMGEVDTARLAARFASVGRPYQPPSIPALPASPETDPAYIVVKGDPTPDELAPITALHALYQYEHARLKAARDHTARLNAERRAWQQAHPPQPEDIVIKHWNSSGHQTAPAAGASEEGGDQ